MRKKNDINSSTFRGRLAVVTGATGGIGKALVRALVLANAEVIIAVRSPTRGNDLVSELRGSIPAGRLRVLELDLASLASISQAAQHLLNEGRPIDFLFNNAGVMVTGERQTTADGFELQFGVNHLGHFALTGQLLPLLKLSPVARVILLGSLMSNFAQFDWKNLNSEKKYRGTTAYGVSKLACIAFALELKRRSENLGWNVKAAAAHPGSTLSNLLTSETAKPKAGLLSLSKLVSQDPQSGILPLLHAATDPENSDYFGPAHFGGLSGGSAVAKLPKGLRNPEDWSRLWKISEELTGVSLG